ncbi:hypothetical protein L873DRAFT_1815271 [Choiromyces venosus 120613-1]|uniref:Uncharacterized protein n=1 Tax=Choiromyces venosus 120613-1 TaxID=1336337 RepID=A0A3N4JJ68_9PEZI|nr:hypothetical protein L873DRAFT_1815271 [Choiromyces venosus 120613-1]
MAAIYWLPSAHSDPNSAKKFDFEISQQNKRTVTYSNNYITIPLPVAVMSAPHSYMLYIYWARFKLRYWNSLSSEEKAKAVSAPSISDTFEIEIGPYCGEGKWSARF